MIIDKYKIYTNIKIKSPTKNKSLIYDKFSNLS